MVQTETLLRLAQLGYRDRHWYRDARAAITRICEQNGWDRDAFIDVMAITSPRVQVSRNWAATYTYMRKGELPAGTMRSTRTALAYWKGGGGIRGRKTGPFAAALRGDEDALVLDVWMALALNVDERKVTNKANMAAARRRVERIAEMMDMTVAETQAAIWCGIIRERGGMPARFEVCVDGRIRLHSGTSKPLFGDV